MMGIQLMEMDAILLALYSLTTPVLINPAFALKLVELIINNMWLIGVAQYVLVVILVVLNVLMLNQMELYHLIYLILFVLSATILKIIF